MRKTPLFLIILGGLLLAGLPFWTLPVKPVSAQCKGPSECSNCHEIQGQNPVGSVGAWHTDHVTFTPCNACHNGAAEATDPDEAHVGVVTVLADQSTNCKQCHSGDLEAKFGVYAKLAGVDPQAALAAAQKGTDITTTLSGFLGQAPAQVGAAAPTPVAVAKPKFKTPTPTKPVNTTGNALLGGLLVLGVVGGGAYINWNERRLTRLRGPRARSWLADLLRRELWSPYAAGVLLGLTCILVVLLAHRRLGASAAVASLGSTLVAQADPAGAGKLMYFRFLMPPGFNWEIALLIGVFIGGLLGALSSGTFKLRWNDDPTWQKIYGAARWKRFVVGFIGAVILQYGAGIAGGCTSGLAISGGMLLAPSAFIFMAGMFISGIIVTVLVFRRRY